MNHRHILLFLLFTSSTQIELSAGQQKKYHSQYLQDEFLNEKIFKNKRKGIFIEVGAYDGVKYSNTLFYERNLGWKGICVEPMPDQYKKLKLNRPNSKCIQGCVGPKRGKKKFRKIQSKNFRVEMLSGLCDEYEVKHLERAQREMQEDGGNFSIIEVECYPLNDLMEQFKLYDIDYLSIDTEGGELSILKSIDFDKFNIFIVQVENNYADRRFREYM